MAEIRSINALKASRENDNRLMSPVECLEDALTDIREGEASPKSLLVIGLDEGADGQGYEIRFWMSRLDTAQAVALMEALKFQLLSDMKLVPDG